MITSTLTVFCDFPGCPTWECGDGIERTKHELRRHTKPLGWARKRMGGINGNRWDLCPVHRKETDSDHG